MCRVIVHDDDCGMGGVICIELPKRSSPRHADCTVESQVTTESNGKSLCPSLPLSLLSLPL